jgi:hypothetical protein
MTTSPHSLSARRRRIVFCSAFCAPMLALVAGQIMSASGPSIAAASSQGDEEPVVIHRIPDRPVPAAIIDRATELRQRSLTNPLYYSRAPQPVVVRQEPREEPPPVEIRRPAPFLLSAVMRGRDGSARAFIDGKLYANGEELAPGWVILDIDATRRQVTVRKPDSSTMLLLLQQDDR